MKKTKKSQPYISSASVIMRSSPATLILAVIGILLGGFFIFYQSVNNPIERTEAISYSGTFKNYESRRKDCKIYFRDGSCYEIYPHTESSAFREAMLSLDKGTPLYILVNPNNDYVVEIKTDTQELLNFEQSQEAIDTYDNGYFFIGCFCCAGGAFLILYTIGSIIYKRKEAARHALKSKNAGTASTPIRSADPAVKSKILLEASVNGYRICYRRVKSVNELVINGKVYDEKKGVIEFAHKLCAILDGHSIEAGYDENDCSYIKFDGKIIKNKKRYF